MVVLPDAWLRLLNVLIEAPTAWRSPSEIASALQRGEGETTDLLCDLDVDGWLVVWETKAGPLVTLSPLAAERLGVRLVEVGHGETPRWARAGDPDPASVRSRQVCLSERAVSLEYVADPGLPPDLAAERGERAEKLALAYQAAAARGARRDEPPRPTVLIGLSLTPWPGPPTEAASVCPACGDRTLSPHMYCLYCDRWGLDALAPDGVATPGTPAPGRRRPPPSEPARVVDEKLVAARLRDRRKSRRRARHKAKHDVERGASLNPQNPAPPPRDVPGPSPTPLHSPPGKHSDKAAR